MRRIYPAHAYGPVPRADCYWPTTVTLPNMLQISGDVTADIAVIGGGFTGMSAALHLAEAGADVVVLEGETLGWGASGRNGGFCCLGGSAASNAMLARQHGESARREYRQTEVDAVALARGLMTRHGIDADTHSEGETLMAHTTKAMQGFEAKAASIETDYGVTPTIVAREDLSDHGMGGPFFGAMTTPIGIAVNPLRYLGGMVDAALAAGVRIFARSAVRRIDQSGVFTLRTDTGTLRAKRLIVATNGYSSDDLPDWLRARYLPTQSNIIVTREMSVEEREAQGWTTHQMCYDDRFFLHYFRLMPNGRMLFGMRGGLRCSPKGDAAMFRNIRRHFDRMFPKWAHVETAHQWHGLLSISNDLTPFAGPIPGMEGAFAALSYHGNGVAMGSYAGALLADLAMERPAQNLHPQIMKTPPKRMPLGQQRRFLMWPAYGAAMLSGD